MIRVNLLEVKSVRRRKRSSGSGGNKGLLILGLVVLELAGLYNWYQGAEDALSQESQAKNMLFQEKQNLEEIQTQITSLNKLSKEVAMQRSVFNKLEHGKVGPMNMLLYLSYSLRRVDMATMSASEQDILNKNWKSTRKIDGIQQRWDPQRVWLKSVVEEKGLVTITGGAKEHDDVAIFIRRLRTGIYFDGLDLVSQQRSHDDNLKKDYIEFQLQCELNYSPTGYPGLE